MDTGLAGDVVAVLGAAGGIGAAIAHAFAAEGCALALLDRRDGVVELAAALRAEHGIRVFGRSSTRPTTRRSRLRRPRSAASWARRSTSSCRLASARASSACRSGRWSPLDWPEVVRVNLMSCVHAAHAFVPGLLPQGRGSFCFLSSVAGQIGSPTDPPYSAAKAAVLNFTQCAARDLAEYGIRANALCPGMVATELNRSVWQAWQARTPGGTGVDHETWAAGKMRRVTPLARWQTPADVAAAAVFLASRLADNVTGQTINVDGGQVMHA